jgi:hypothetical protein
MKRQKKQKPHKKRTKTPQKRTKNFFLSIPAKRDLQEAPYPPVKKIESSQPA